MLKSGLEIKKKQKKTQNNKTSINFIKKTFKPSVFPDRRYHQEFFCEMKENKKYFLF